MKLFEVIPEQLFQIFSGKNRHIYAEALLHLNQQYHIYRFGIHYDIMRDLIQELLETQEESGNTFDDNEEQEKIESTEDDLLRARACIILRRLEKLGWIQIETRDNFNQYIVLPHYSSRFLTLFNELCENRAVEYQRFTFITYQLLSGEEVKQRPSFAVLEAERMTQQFLDELKILVNNMKHHMEQVATKTSIQEVLSHHFEEYKAQIIDRSYHRLKTSDHVSRYRRRILETVQKWLLDHKWIDTMIEDALKNELFKTRDDAGSRLREALHGIEEIYRKLDEIFYEIDLRHNQYLRASFDRARYLSQHSHGVDNYLAGILETISRQIEQETITDDILLPEFFHLLSFNLLNEKSLYTQRSRRASHEPESQIFVEISDELKKELREKNLLRLKRAITRDKVRQYVLKRLNGRTEMGIEELVPMNIDEFLYLLHVYLYGYDRLSGYQLVKDDHNRILMIGGYKFYYRKIISITD